MVTLRNRLHVTGSNANATAGLPGNGIIGDFPASPNPSLVSFSSFMFIYHATMFSRLQSTASINPHINTKPVINGNGAAINFNSKGSSSHITNQLPHNSISNKLVNSYKNNHVVTTRNISVPLPLPNQEIDMKNQNNDSKEQNIMHQGKICILVIRVKFYSKPIWFTDIQKKNFNCDMDDLIHLLGPLTEDAVMKTLQARFNEKKYFVSSL